MSFNEEYVRIVSARSPEELFPEVTTIAALKKAVRRISSIVHPDINPQNQMDADAAFKRMTTWAQRAEQKIKSGRWRDGQPFAEFQFRTTRGRYDVFGLSRREALFDSIDAALAESEDSGVEGNVLLHVARLTRYENLVESAYRSLDRLYNNNKFPMVLDVLRLNGRSAYVTTPTPPGFVPLSKIMETAPDGIAVADMLCYSESLLRLLELTAKEDVVHGAINPSSWWVCPSDGSSFLTDWHYSVRRGQVVAYTNETYAGLCPWEVRERKATDRGTDTAAMMAVLREVVGLHKLSDSLFRLIHEHLREVRNRPDDPVDCRRKIRAIRAEK